MLWEMGVMRGDGIAPHRAEEAGDYLADSANNKQLIVFIS